MPPSAILRAQNALREARNAAKRRANHILRRASLDDVPAKRFVRLTKAVTVYKRVDDPERDPLVATLRIPKGTLVYTGDQDRSFCKMRCERAKVLRIQRFKRLITEAWCGCAYEYLDHPTDLESAESLRDSRFKYLVGKTVKPTKPFSRAKYECAPGIHFFRTVSEAKNY